MPQLDSGLMRPKPRTTLAYTLLAAVVGLLLAGCGGSSNGEIPTDQAESLNQAVEQARDSFNNGKCDEADAALADAQQQIDSLDVSDDVRDGLSQLADNLERRLAEDCEPVEETTTTTTSEPTTTTTTSTTTTDDTTSTSTTDDTTSSDTTSTEPDVTTEPPVSPPPGNGPDGTGPPGQGGSGGTAPRKDAKSAEHEKKPKPKNPAKNSKDEKEKAR